MNLLFIGDVFGEIGREYLEQKLPLMIQKHKVDVCVANCENAAHGRGLSEKNYNEILSSGVDIITMGNHVWGNSELAPLLKLKDTKVVRPCNIGKTLPGVGYKIFAKKGVKIGVTNIEGRVFIDLVGDNPFEAADEIIKQMDDEGAKIKIIDFHAEATSEKKLMAMYTDGRVSAVIGTHTHVQTADEQILPNGTAFITDVGMTGISRESVLGMEYKGVSEKIIKGLPARFEPCVKGTPEIRAVLIKIDEETGKATQIERINE